MTLPISLASRAPLLGVRVSAVPVVVAIAFAAAFFRPLQQLVYEWINRPEASHGLLLAGVAVWLLWRDRAPKAGVRAAPAAGLALVVAGCAVAYVAQVGSPSRIVVRLGIAAVLIGLVVYYRGWAQLRQWWLPVLLLFLALPLPGSVITSVALPLQLIASRIGASLLEFRHVPAVLAGNVIRIPGHDLFVTEACSGLRSLASLVSLAVLVGGLWLRTVSGRVAIVLVAVPVAILLNGVRVFLTGFLTHFVSPAAGEGFMHASEGWLLVVVALGVLGTTTFIVSAAEQALRRRRA